MERSKRKSSETSGFKVLVVEDEWIVAMDLEALLIDAGYTVIGPASRVEDALQLHSKDAIDIALLDMNLGGETSEPIALRLQDDGIPFVFLSGHSEEHVDPQLKSAAHLSKPVTEDALLCCLADVLSAKKVD